MVLMLMGWPYTSFDCLLIRTEPGFFLGQIIKILQKEGLAKLLKLISWMRGGGGISTPPKVIT